MTVKPHLPPSAPRSLFLADDDAGEDGMLSLVSLFIVLAFMATFAVLTNVGKTVTQKIEVQNGADSVAYAAGLEMARGMNSVTTANHLIGELQALCVLHHGFGGEELDEDATAKPTPSELRDDLRNSYRLARVFASRSIIGPPREFMFNKVVEEPTSGAAIRASQMRLKQVMTWAYVGHAIGGMFTLLREAYPVGTILAGFGELIIANCFIFETKVYTEWLILNSLEVMCKRLRIIKTGMQDLAMPGLYLYTRALKYETALKAEAAARGIGEKNKVDVSLFPGLTMATSVPPLKLRIAPEPTNLGHTERSQLVRASTPWIQYWRLPILKFGEDALFLSRFKCYYQDFTDKFTIERAKFMKTDKKVNPVILKDLELDGEDKTYELWTYANEGSREADRIFCLIGFAHRAKTGGAAIRMFRQGNPDGLLAYAQVMVYNGNPQVRGQTGGWQRTAGWDTLNWGNTVPEVTSCNPNVGTCPIPDAPKPLIRINWRVKLVPTTRLHEAILWQRGEIGAILRRTLPDDDRISITRTH